MGADEKAMRDYTVGELRGHDHKTIDNFYNTYGEKRANRVIKKTR